MNSTIYWIICLISAHIFADFPLQTRGLIKYKRKFWGLMLHGAIHGILTYVICAQWSMWYLPIVIAISHAVLDLIKKRHWHLFILDQGLHVLVLVAIVFILPFDESFAITKVRLYFVRGLVLVNGLIVVTMGAGIFIGKIMYKHMKRNELKLSGLINGGLWIGLLERLMIFILVF